MRLKQVKISNFKSLKNICFSPSEFTAIVGANASGKTNFAKALSFLAEVYEIGLERAILNAGGYENIALRKQRRSKAPISFETVVELDKNDLRNYPREREKTKSSEKVYVHHKFSLTAIGGGIKADFKVDDEEVLVKDFDSSGNENLILHFTRDENGKINLLNLNEQIIKEFEKSPLFRVKSPKRISKNTKESAEIKYQQLLFDFAEEKIKEQELVLLNFPIEIRYLIRFSELDSIISLFIFTVSRFKVFQLSPVLARRSSPPIPNPFLSSTGENLPTMVDSLKRSSTKQWQSVLEKMREVLPGLIDISTDYIYTRELALFFEEEGVGRPWRAEEVSDGTILTLALLIAAFEGRSTLTLFDEIENSLHPWVLRTVVETLRSVSKIKNVIITTHSPILVDLLNPDELWVIYRKNGESHLKKLTEIDPEIETEFKEGKYTLSTYLDSGYIGQYAPGGVF
ncbi:MAG: AAA family ATPase [Pyrinomonadaceae bacterium]|nr:AAA family ATPase [Pyrinomonadaceae bacterium]